MLLSAWYRGGPGFKSQQGGEFFNENKVSSLGGPTFIKKHKKTLRQETGTPPITTGKDTGITGLASVKISSFNIQKGFG